MTLAANETDRIVALRLDGRSLRDVAAVTGHALATVHKVWHAYLTETAQARRPELDLLREAYLQRLERNAADARAGVIAARDEGAHPAVARYLAAELAALHRLGEAERLLAVEAPSAGAGLPDARERLTDYLVGLVKAPPAPV